MLNIKPLNNFPVKIWNEFRKNWEVFHNGEPPEMTWSPAHKASEISEIETKHLASFLPQTLPLQSIEIYYIQPNDGTNFHIDRGRKTALQIPIDVPKNSFTFASNTRDLELLTPINIRFDKRKTNFTILNNNKHMFYAWDDNFIDKHPMNVPVLSAVEYPHGGMNNSDTVRIFYSISFKEPIDVVVEHYKDYL